MKGPCAHQLSRNPTQACIHDTARFTFRGHAIDGGAFRLKGKGFIEFHKADLFRTRQKDFAMRHREDVTDH